MKKLAIFLFLFNFLAGCEFTPIVGPIVNGVIAWQEGEAKKYYTNGSSVVYRAAKRALIDMELQLSEDETLDNQNYHIKAGNNDRFKIKVEYVEPEITLLKVRINFMGDKPYAELFYRKVDENLNGIEFDPQGRPTQGRRWQR